jgi:hypothetical protein
MDISYEVRFGAGGLVRKVFGTPAAASFAPPDTGASTVDICDLNVEPQSKGEE